MQSIMPHCAKRKIHWDSVYGSHAEQDVSWFELAPNVSFDLVRLNSNGLTGSIMDVGGGNSHLVDLLLEAGFSNVRVLDVSSRAIQMAQARLGQRAREITWIESDVLEWNGPRDVDIWHDRATYHFLTDLADRALYAKVAARTIVPSGTLIVETFALEGPRSCSGLPVQRASAETIQNDFASDFNLLESFVREHITPTGARQLFQVCRLQRKSS